MTPTIPDFFKAKKQKILAGLSAPESEYSDNSPKGSVDEPILGLIDLINSYPGWCTTSSCSGRVAVFVEGPKNTPPGVPASSAQELDGYGQEDETTTTLAAVTASTAKKPTKVGPGGKGGGHWLFVSHYPLADTTNVDQLNIMTPASSDGTVSTRTNAVTMDYPSSQRLVHLSFSPLILHVLCASLDHARPLLAAAINAGYRESGVHSLKVLEEPEKGVMVAIRTAGLAFSTVVGTVADVGMDRVDSADDEEEGRTERRSVIVSEDYLRMCLSVVNERFKWNDERKTRLEAEIRGVFGRDEQGRRKAGGRVANGQWESKEDRRRRKREEGLRRQKEAPPGKVIVDTDASSNDFLDVNLDEI